ncbi:MAG TPA: transglycosylase SLT domain-containing protein [Scandinavium sp.]|jgi:hypothetical protein
MHQLSAIPAAYQQIAAAEYVPPESLYALAMVESARKSTWGALPWPWTINVAGKGYRYPSREAAGKALLGFMQRYPLRHIDVGIAQVNLGWNGQYFSSLKNVFDPYTNLHIAAQILRRCYTTSSGSWLRASGCYHHPAGGKAASRYITLVRHQIARVIPRSVLQEESMALAHLNWIEPQ